MAPKQHNPNTLSVQLHRIFVLVMIVITILQIIKKYELICKRRNYHDPNEVALNDFFDNKRPCINTECVDCGCALQITLDDDDDSNTYWIQEI